MANMGNATFAQLFTPPPPPVFWYTNVASHSPYLVGVYSVINFRPDLRHFWANLIFAIPALSLSVYAFIEPTHLLNLINLVKIFPFH